MEIGTLIECACNTYDQIHRKVWGEDAYGDESNAIGCRIRHLWEKLYEAEPDAPFTIRCVTT